MATLRSRVSVTGITAAFGAGLAAALLSLMPALKSPDGLSSQIGAIPAVTVFAFLMAFVAPLPIMVASIGFGTIAGLVAAVIGAIAVGIVDLRPEALAGLPLHSIASGGLQTLVFAVSFGLPSWLLARVALLPPRSIKSGQALKVRPDEFRLGVVIACAILFAVLSTALDVAIALDAKGGFHGFVDASAKQIEPLLRANESLAKGVDPHVLAVRFVFSALAFMAAAELLLLVVNLWLAARIAQLSGLLATHWPDVPSSFRVPRPFAIVLAVALGLSFAGGPVGMGGVIVSGVLLMAFVIQGLAVVHALTRAKSYRLPLLIIVYLTLIWTIAFYALLGLLDAGFAFRDRQKPIVRKT